MGCKNNENLIKQEDEMLTLEAMYPNLFVHDRRNKKKFRMAFKEISATRNTFSLTLKVELPPGYPSEASPIYNIDASWLNQRELSNLKTMLADIFNKNIGKYVIHIWVERIQQFLMDILNPNVLAETTKKAGKSSNGSEINSEILKEKKQGENEYDFEYKPYVPEVPKIKPEDELPPIYHGESVIDRKSEFQGHLAPICHQNQVQMVVNKLKENNRINSAKHNIVAYRLETENGKVIANFSDDGEHQAGGRVLHVLEQMDARNVMVVVTRWFGNILLGPDRFKHYNSCARDILEEHGYLQHKIQKRAKKPPSPTTVPIVDPARSLKKKSRR